MPHTVTLHRVIRAPVERVYRAFLDPEAMAKWLPPDGFTCTVERADARVGGSHRARFTNFATGHVVSFGGEYLELIPSRLLRYTDRFDDAGLPGEITVTVELRDVTGGTDLRIVQAGIPDVIPPAMCHLGWQDSLRQLASLVETAAP